MATNQLISETSPYLLQHAHNPVDWYPWGTEAFEKAKREDKLILISIGYSACHWCHVMERESFEDSAVAEIMNAQFVCVKVDREERPDVDKIYMEAVQMLSGRGGWPLNCFALSDGRPVWGGTYFPQKQWTELLHTLHGLYTNEREKLLTQAEQLTQGIRQQDFPNIATIPETADFEYVIASARKNFDWQHGGMGKAPKFPMPVALNFLHQYGHLKKDEEVLSFIYLTLDKMASGGIYDQAGGGFARYSVDERWFAPHFEKMLYDNAQLISLYSNAYKTSQGPLYKRIIDETIHFVKRELLAPEGAFYSALDADSEGVEGKFYTWTQKELHSILKEDDLLFDYFDIQTEGNWEQHQNILHAHQTRDQYAASNHLNPVEFEHQMNESLKKLLQKRSSRIRPGLDHKIILSWNGLMIKALTDAHQAIGDTTYLDLAEQAMQQLLNTHITSSGRVNRIAVNQDSQIEGFLDDYAFTIEALISLYETTFKTNYLDIAQSIMQYAIQHFYQDGTGMFYYTSDTGEQLIARKTDLQDNVIPSAVSTMTNNLIKLAQLNHHTEYEDISRLLIAKMQEQIERYPTYHAQWALLTLLQDEYRQEIAICGPEAFSFKKILQAQFIPGTVYAGSSTPNSSIDLLKNRFNEGQTLIYHCKNKSCELPIEQPDGIINHPQKH